MLAAYLLDGLFLAAVCARISIPLLAICGFGAMFTSPITNATNQAIWQAKVPPNLQGRVFGFSRSIAMSVSIVAPLLAAPLADYVFKPGMSAGGAFAAILGPLIGIGPEHGTGVLISLVGVGIMVATLIALSIPALRRVELELPDHGTIVETISAQPV
jgi:hypothetical protein